jgi:hypothetical protein
MAMVAEFDEYTNDWLYLREGTFFPKYTSFNYFLILSAIYSFDISTSIFLQPGPNIERNWFLNHPSLLLGEILVCREAEEILLWNHLQCSSQT